MTVQVGPFVVDGPAKRVKWVKSALALLDNDVDPNALLPKPTPLTFGPVKNIPGTNSPAVGFTLKGPKLEIRHDVQGASNLSYPTTVYTVLHEGFGHGRMVLRPLGADKRTRLRALLKGPLGTGYWYSEVEVIIDAVVEAISGATSPYRFDPKVPNARAHYQRWIDEADYPQVKAIWLEPDPVAPPPPDPDPDPLPDPPDPCAEAVAVVTKQLIAERDAHDATTAKLNAAKTKAAEIVAL